MIEKLHEDTYTQAEALILCAVKEGTLRENVREFIHKLFHMPEMVFFIENENDIIALFETLPDQDIQSFKQIEADLFERILQVGGIVPRCSSYGQYRSYLHLLVTRYS